MGCGQGRHWEPLARREGPSVPWGQVSPRQPLSCWSLGEGRWDEDFPVCAHLSRGRVQQAV